MHVCVLLYAYTQGHERPAKISSLSSPSNTQQHVQSTSKVCHYSLHPTCRGEASHHGIPCWRSKSLFTIYRPFKFAPRPALHYFQSSSTGSSNGRWRSPDRRLFPPAYTKKTASALSTRTFHTVRHTLSTPVCVQGVRVPLTYYVHEACELERQDKVALDTKPRKAVHEPNRGAAP